MPKLKARVTVQYHTKDGVKVAAPGEVFEVSADTAKELRKMGAVDAVSGTSASSAGEADGALAKVNSKGKSKGKKD